MFAKTGRLYVLDNEGAVVKSDTAIPESLASELIAAIKPLEDIPENQKDWHPRSEDKVLDLVHPSLYPLMYGKSRVLPNQLIPDPEASLKFCGQGEITRKPDSNELELDPGSGTHLYNGQLRQGVHWGVDGPFVDPERYCSADYQWLPCDVAFRPRSSPNEELEVWISSYINNLHPVLHKGLYSVLSKIIAKTVPMWDDVLGYLENERHFESRIPFIGTEYDFPLGWTRPREPKESKEDGDAADIEEDEERESELDEKWERENRVLLRPEPREFSPHNPEQWKPLSLADKYQDEGIQVIVKLANIELSPGGKEKYGGGTWHIEGQLNERICASSIYYYAQENITASRLSFRQLTSSEDLRNKTYGQDDYSGVEILHGVKQGGPCVQYLGSVSTRQGRIIAFPNVLQHQVQPFELADPTKPGYRKILALFLVDPHRRVLSTANVPPQQRDWWWSESVAGNTPAVYGTRLQELPVEILDKVVKEIDGTQWPISLEEAKRVRRHLMEQRGIFAQAVNEDYEHSSFSFCEH